MTDNTHRTTDQQKSIPIKDKIFAATEVMIFQAKRIDFRVKLLLYEKKIKAETMNDESIMKLTPFDKEELNIQRTRAEILLALMKRITEHVEICGRTVYPMNN